MLVFASSRGSGRIRVKICNAPGKTLQAEVVDGRPRPPEHPAETNEPAPPAAARGGEGGVPGSGPGGEGEGELAGGGSPPPPGSGQGSRE